MCGTPNNASNQGRCFTRALAPMCSDAGDAAGRRDVVAQGASPHNAAAAVSARDSGGYRGGRCACRGGVGQIVQVEYI